jgi:hypothetical protein
MIATFYDFIHQFLELYLDDWNVYNLLREHIGILILMLERCMQLHISICMQKCIFYVPFGNFLGHIVCQEGDLVNSAEIVVILNMPSPTNFK